MVTVRAPTAKWPLLFSPRLLLPRSHEVQDKLAMFVQPFILATLVIAWFGLARRRLVRVVPLLALAAVGWPAQSHYVSASAGEGSALQLPGGSQRAIRHG